MNLSKWSKSHFFGTIFYCLTIWRLTNTRPTFCRTNSEDGGGGQDSKVVVCIVQYGIVIVRGSIIIRIQNDKKLKKNETKKTQRCCSSTAPSVQQTIIVAAINTHDCCRRVFSLVKPTENEIILRCPLSAPSRPVALLLYNNRVCAVRPL